MWKYLALFSQSSAQSQHFPKWQLVQNNSTYVSSSMDFTHFWWVMKPQNFQTFFSLMQQNRKIKFNFENNPVINFTSYIMFYRLFYFTIQFIFILLYFEENLSINQFELCFFISWLFSLRSAHLLISSATCDLSSCQWRQVESAGVN